MGRCRDAALPFGSSFSKKKTLYFTTCLPFLTLFEWVLRESGKLQLNLSATSLYESK